MFLISTDIINVIIHISFIRAKYFFTLNRKPSVPAASGGKPTTTGKLAAQTTPVPNEKSQNKSKTLIAKAKQIDKSVKLGMVPPTAAERKAVVSQKPEESSTQDDKSDVVQSSNKESVGAGVVDGSKDNAAIKDKPVPEAKVSVKSTVPQTPTYPSDSLDGAGPASEKAEEVAAQTSPSISTTSADQPQTGDNEEKSLPEKSETADNDTVVKMDTTEVNKSTETHSADLNTSELTGTGNEAATPDGSRSCTDNKVKNVTAEVAAPEKINDKHVRNQPAASTAETPSTKKGMLHTLNTRGIETITVEMFCYKYYDLTCMYSVKIEKLKYMFI